MINSLPAELKLRLLELSPNLRFATKEFFKLWNAIQKRKTEDLLILNEVSFDLALFERYQHTLDFFNGSLNKILSPDINWSLAYNFIINRKIFFTPKLCNIQPYLSMLNSYEYTETNSLKLNDVQTFTFKTCIVLPRGSYILLLGMINHKFARGTGTIKFEIFHSEISLKNHTEVGIPNITGIYNIAQNINEILPIDEHVEVSLGNLKVDSDYALIDIEIQEIGMFPKLHIELEFLEFVQTSRFAADSFHYFQHSGIQNKPEVLNYLSLQGEQITEEDIRPSSPDWEQWYTGESISLHMLTVTKQRELEEGKFRKVSPMAHKVRF